MNNEQILKEIVDFIANDPVYKEEGMKGMHTCKLSKIMQIIDKGACHSTLDDNPHL